MPLSPAFAAELPLQFARLQRHTTATTQSRQILAFKELAHTLRVWADMKEGVDEWVAGQNRHLELPCYPSIRPWRKLARGSEYVNVLCSMAPERDGLTLSGFRMMFRALSDAEAQARARIPFPMAASSRCTFTDWLGHRVIHFAYKGQTGLWEDGFSREMLIRRLANTDGGSHPVSSKGQHDSADAENRYDPVLRWIQDLRPTEIPVPYFILVDIATGLTSSLAPLLGDAAAQADQAEFRSTPLTIPSPITPTT